MLEALIGLLLLLAALVTPVVDNHPITDGWTVNQMNDGALD